MHNMKSALVIGFVVHRRRKVMDTTRFHLNKELVLGPAELIVADLDRSWRWDNGLVVLGNDELNLQILLDEPGSEAPFTSLPVGTRMGHFNVKVSDAGLTATEPFYRDVLGFDVTGRIGNGLLFVSVGGYHGYLELNNGFSRNGSEPAPHASAHLVGLDLILLGPADVQALAHHLAVAQHPYTLEADVLSVRDPSGNVLRFAAQPS